MPPPAAHERPFAVSPDWIALTALAIRALVALVLWIRGRPARRLANRREAARQFHARRAELEPAFLAAANATGKPRGLRWVSTRFDPSVLFAADRSTAELYALAGATVSFEAIEGGGMEEVEAVGNLRYATAVFAYRNGHWSTDGRAVFNLEPAQAIERFGDSLEPLQLD
jgi:hypothetical protein